MRRYGATPTLGRVQGRAGSIARGYERGARLVAAAWLVALATVGAPLAFLVVCWIANATVFFAASLVVGFGTAPVWSIWTMFGLDAAAGLLLALRLARRLPLGARWRLPLAAIGWTWLMLPTACLCLFEIALVTSPYD